MNQSSKKIGFASTLVKLFAAAALIVGAVASQQAAAAIKNTKHNLSSTGTGTNHANNSGNYTEEICVFCHTPHGSNTGVAAPLWNKKNTNQTYTVYSSTTLDAGTPVIGSVSLACLSCHDGTQAMDNMVNAPGSGWNGSGSGTNTGVDQGYSWTGSKQLNGTYASALGIDLSNDHPIGIEYCGGGSGTSYTGGDNGTCADKDFNTATYEPSKAYWYVEASNNAIRDKGDIILYNRTSGGTTKPYVECASCHDPHVESKGTAQAPQVAFLRVNQSGSGVCLACHNK